MQRMPLSGMMFGLLLSCCGGVLMASQADELRERAMAMRLKAAVVAEQGNMEQAERLERESVELLEFAERMELKAKGNRDKGGGPAIDKDVQRLKERLHDLLIKEQELRAAKVGEQDLAEVRAQISSTERELQQTHQRHAGHGELPPRFRAQAEKLEIAVRRIHHLRVAAENLEVAQEHDLAHQLRDKSEAMERDVQEAKQRLAAQMHEDQEHPGDHGPEVVRELKEEILRLRAQIEKLHQKVERR